MSESRAVSGMMAQRRMSGVFENLRCRPDKRRVRGDAGRAEFVRRLSECRLHCREDPFLLRRRFAHGDRS